MATQPSPQQAPPAPSSQYHGTPPWLHNFAVAAAILSPIGMLLPPRRLDFRLTVLSAGAFWGTSQLAHDYTGRSIYRRYRDRVERWAGGDLPEKAQQTQALMQAERLRRRELQQGGQTEDAGKEQGLKPVLHRVWMGGEREDWVEERKAKEKEALEDGRGYWGLISEQIREVWTQGGKKGETKTEEVDGSSTGQKPSTPKRSE